MNPPERRGPERPGPDYPPGWDGERDDEPGSPCTAYCPACLDVWCITDAKLAARDFVNIRPGTRLHVTCGRALEALRTAPATFEFEPETRGWAA